MEPLLLLVHRIPFPPNKGDKVRSFHLLEFLASRYRVHLGTFVDSTEDLVHIPRLQEYCASSKVIELKPALARIRSLAGLFTGEAMTLRYYRDAALAEWVRSIVREQGITKAVVFSSAMAPYALNLPQLQTVVDFVDVDSAKWSQYAQSRPWPLSAIFRREGTRLLAFERAVAGATEASVFVTPAEAQLFRTLAPECAARVHYAQNGVDTHYFSPEHELSTPFHAEEEAIVFTGAMDYWPNVDAVSWFANEMLPAVVAHQPRARFYIVGVQPTPAVQALAQDSRVVVTGRVPDVRPYIKHARVVVAPLRVARGIQNKVLEAMAMARPVVVSVAAAGALSGVAATDFDVADGAAEFIRKTIALMDGERGMRIGKAARERVLADYDWTKNLTPFDALLHGRAEGRAGAARVAVPETMDWPMQDKRAAAAARPTPAAIPAATAPVRDLGNALIVVLLLAWVLTLYLPTTLSMVSIWERSETFAHGYVVFPIFLYLLWRERETLASIERTRYLPALLGVAGAGAVWFIGERVNAAVVAQLAMVAMIPFSVWAVLGTRVASALCIPLAFLFFAVPFGDFLVPPLMNWTADFTVAAIKASGVPVYREGNNLLIPSGRWSVVEACSGIRYLIASLMVGCLYAYLSYRSLARRVLFIVASIIVPIVANWLRAYMIVMLGHLSNNRIAVGVDHLIYGWVFFGIVMALLFWAGSRWREDDIPFPASRVAPPTPARTASPATRAWPMLLAVVALTAIWPTLEAYQDRGAKREAFTLPQISPNNGWTGASGGLPDWRPDVAGASAELRQTFLKNGRDVGLHIAFFRNQTNDAKAITSTNQVVNTSNALWAQVGTDTIDTTIDGKSFSAQATEVAGNHRRLVVWQWFWVNGHETTSEYLAKFYQVLSVLQGRGDPVAWVIAYTPADNGMAGATSTLREFAVDMRGPIDALLRQAATP